MMTKEEIEKQYEVNKNTPSDINQHLPKLREYADKCEHVTEMGVRGCVSLYAALASNAKKVVAIDILNVAVPDVEKLTFILASTLDIVIPKTDFLFIDTLHTYEQLKQELALHHSQVKKYIGFHDTEIFGKNGEDGGQGLNKAIHEFMNAHPEWSIDYVTNINNGLTILIKR